MAAVLYLAYNHLFGEKIPKIFEYRKKLPSVLVDIIDVYVISWGGYEFQLIDGKYTLIGINSLQENYLKEDLLDRIKNRIPSFEEKITMKDVCTYDEIERLKLKRANAFSKAVKWTSLTLMKYYPSDDSADYEWAMKHSAKSGYLDIIQYCESKGAKDYDRAMKNAGYGCHKDVIVYLESKGAKTYTETIDRLISYNNENDYFEIMDYLINKAPKQSIDYKLLIKTAKYNKNSKTVNYLKKKRKIEKYQLVV